MREDPSQIWVTPFHQPGAEAESQKEKEAAKTWHSPLCSLVGAKDRATPDHTVPHPHRGLHPPKL